MRNNPNFKTDMVIFAIVIFLLGVVFSMFVLEKDPDARLGLFGISIWVLVIAGAIYWRQQKSRRDKEEGTTVKGRHPREREDL